MNFRTVRVVAIFGFAVAAAATAAFVLGGEVRARSLAAGEPYLLTSVLCLTSGSADAAPTFESEMASVNERMHLGMTLNPTGNPDRDFARMMIPHHQGAVDMALVQLKYGRDKALRRLAQSIIVEQQQEIAYMRSLLAKPDADDKTFSFTKNERAM